MAKCIICNNDEAFIALGKWRESNKTFSDLLSRQVCWECYVAVVRPVDKKLENAEARIKGVFNRPVSYLRNGQYRRDLRNVEAWKQAIATRQLQRQIYCIGS